MFSILLLAISLMLTAQMLFTVYLMVYTWEDADRLSASCPPTDFLAPHYTFTVLLPAREEKDVINETIRRVWAVQYPKDLLEIRVICHEDDACTIKEAQCAVVAINAPQIQVVTFNDTPVNKPHALNAGFGRSSNEIVAVFDAEDDISPDILQVVNTIMLQENVGVVQGGVQLMNFQDRWFSLHNCLEYFFWFKSRLHFHAHIGMIPLGGNTVFFRRQLLDRIGGWDDLCLTEDADIGLRLSAIGVPIRVFYDPQLITREETPQSIGQFIRQRTRWHQGFLQVLRKGTWRLLPRRRQRWLAMYSLAFPWFQGGALVIAPLTLFAGLWVTIPVVVAMASFLPFYGLGMQALITVIGAFAFTKDYGLRIRVRDIIIVLLAFLPYQIVQGISAVRAVFREVLGQTNWEKTTHVGAHR